MSPRTLAAVALFGLLVYAASLGWQSTPSPAPGPAPAPVPPFSPSPAPCPEPGPCPRRPSHYEAAEYKIQTAGPELDGEAIATDLPANLHVKNVGGSDGAGLCVFTSGLHAAYFQNVRHLWGWRKWMEKRPGGGYPEKVDTTLALYCQEKGYPIPDYVQHTGGDERFLELALKTGRMVCVTYSGADGVYYGQPVAHMVNLVHLSPRWAVILDNNFPAKYLWLPRTEFLKRWRGHGGGWAYCFLAAPPPPIPVN